ncbi:MAG: hypothetical protein QM831_14415 [Kofleriaceae bacterium]
MRNLTARERDLGTRARDLCQHEQIRRDPGELLEAQRRGLEARFEVIAMRLQELDANRELGHRAPRIGTEERVRARDVGGRRAVRTTRSRALGRGEVRFGRTESFVARIDESCGFVVMARELEYRFAAIRPRDREMQAGLLVGRSEAMRRFLNAIVREPKIAHPRGRSCRGAAPA